MSKSLDMVMDEAIAWHLALDEAGTDEWRQFIAWLETSPAHQAAYDRVTISDAALAATVIEPSLPLGNQVDRRGHVGPDGRSWLRWGGAAGGLVAAAAAAWMAMLPGVATHGDSYAIETPAGKRHSVTLADGTRIDMNGDTRILLDRDNPRFATLERGEAVFDVVHHADRPFEVRSGDVILQDVGTVFNVVRSGPRLNVAVAEGAVIFQPKREAVSLTQGMALAMRDGEDTITLSRVQPANVGSWTGDRLDFRAVAMTTVVEDVSRSTGMHLVVSSELAARPFTGTLRIDRPAEEIARNLAAMAGGEARRDGPGWTIRPKSGGAR